MIDFLARVSSVYLIFPSFYLFIFFIFFCEPVASVGSFPNDLLIKVFTSSKLIIWKYNE